MDVLDFIARSEWPVVVGGAIFLFRRQVRALLERVNITKIDAWGFKAEFEKGLDKVEVLTQPVADKSKRPAIAMDEKQQSDAGLLHYRTTDAAYISPSVVVLDAWRRLEGDMRRIYDELHPKSVGGLSVPPRNFEEAAREFCLTQDERASLAVLRNLRNKVAHAIDAPISSDDALRFKVATDRLQERLWEEHAKRSKKPNS